MRSSLKWKILAVKQTAGRSKRFQSLVFALTQQHFAQWSSLPFCQLDCPVARQNLSLVGTAHDCETDSQHKYNSLLI